MKAVRIQGFALLAGVAFVMLSTLAGCGPVMAVPAQASSDAPLDVKSDAVYLLDAGDVIKLTVYGEDTLTGPYTIDKRGFITIPLIGNVQAAGLSREDLQSHVASDLVKGGYLAKPLVTVDIVSVRPFYIIGEVKTPGSYPWQPSLDVVRAIATAGGYTPRAAKNSILIDRGVGPNKQRLNATEDTPILPGDSITVRERIF